MELDCSEKHWYWATITLLNLMDVCEVFDAFLCTSRSMIWIPMHLMHYGNCTLFLFEKFLLKSREGAKGEECIIMKNCMARKFRRYFYYGHSLESMPETDHELTLLMLVCNILTCLLRGIVCVVSVDLQFHIGVHVIYTFNICSLKLMHTHCPFAP